MIINMSQFSYISFALVLWLLFSLQELGQPARSSLESTTCRLLNDNKVALNPWTVHPIVFEPIKRGRLTIWSGSTTIPTSEFRCMTSQSENKSVLIEFFNYANKLEWSFEDLSRSTHRFGNTICHVDGAAYKLNIKDNQASSYLECNRVDDIELINPDESTGTLITSCNGCGTEIISLINSQITELMKSKLNGHIVEKLFWDINQLVYSHHFDHPISLHDQLD